MPKAETKHTTNQSAVADLCALVTAPNPDARLLLACDTFMLLCEERDKLYRQHAKGYMNRVRETTAERNALEAEIANTPARTPAGRCAKADAALYMLGATGTIAMIARSALRDFINSSTSARGGV